MMTRWQQFLTTSLTAVMTTALCALAGFAQTPQPPATQPGGQDQINPLNIQARPIPTRTVGLEPGKLVNWTLKDAILAALENNPDIEIERTNVRRAQFDLFAAQGFYDPSAISNLQYSSRVIPNTSRNTGLGSSVPDINFQTLSYNFGYQQYYERTGGFYSIGFNNTRQTSNQATLTPNYSPSLTFNITQPLARNFGIDSNRRLIQIQRKNLDLSDAVFRQRAIQIIAQVQQAYWDLTFAIKNEEIQRASVKLAETQLNNNKRQVEVGTLAPIDIVSAATDLETRRQQVFQAMNAVAQAENTLKQLTVSSPNDELWTSQIAPVESFEVQTNTLPLPDALKLAMENRPELKQFALQKESKQVDIAFFRNQTRPQIDLVASYGMNGAGGTPSTITGSSPNCSSPLPVGNPNSNPQLVCVGLVPTAIRDQNGNITGYTAGTIQTPFNPAVAFTQTTPVSSAFIGGYGTALKNLFKNDFRAWSVGVNITLPLRNRTAKANLGKALEEERQLDLQTRRQRQSIEVEVRNAVQSAETAKLRIEAARLARIYAEQQLEGENKKFQAGLSTTFFVLQRQTQLAQAQGDEVRALTDYNKAIAELQRVIATTLSSNSIAVREPEKVTLEKHK